MKICGPKLSVCGLIISVWGIIQLVLMGLFYRMKSVALLEDVAGLDEPGLSPAAFYNKAEIGYNANAMNCWIGACLYIVTLLFSGHQFYINSRTSITM